MRAQSRNQRAGFNQGFTRTLCGLYWNKSGDEPSVVGDAEFLAGFNPGEIPRCVLSQFSDSDCFHGAYGSTYRATLRLVASMVALIVAKTGAKRAS